MKEDDCIIDSNGNYVCPKCYSSHSTHLNINCGNDPLMEPSIYTETWFKCDHCGFEDIL